MIIKEIRGKYPQISEDCYLADNATIVGDVKIGTNCSVWFNAVIRGDVNSIEIGNKVNIQDGAVVHCTYLKHPTIIGNNVSIGHNAIVHGCEIRDNVLIGMGAIVMDNCVVNSNSIVAAGSVVTQNTIIESGAIYAGVPAKKVKDINQSDFAGEIERISNNYVMYSKLVQRIVKTNLRAFFKPYSCCPL
ncbi:gamma carbonic anhydrase family protein [Flavobacterium jejuense]|uniref:Gamma carbonic anhydrase family protein n=1 Tax=Flavobacterium jejuense TaxID=1544455 RepID=A0ABX0IRZ3_9FLAO|nr:gamma carbonic anhydrase family protein [Flavobacterium jejuense]NHN26298.1 gamma carbonic anhydrase family protein [Flavobacterium jejuense]